MGFFDATNPLTGDIISHEIEGESPTEEEALEIQQYMALLGKQAIPTDIPGDDGNLFTKGIARGIDNLQLMYGSALEGLGRTTGIDALKSYGAEVIETNQKELEEDAESAKRLDDIKDTGSFFDWAASTLGEQVPQLGSTLAGSYVGGKTGAAIGTAIVPGLGTAAGGVIGSIVGGLTANIPMFFGGNREAQKEEIRLGNRIEIDEGAAFLYSLPQAALDLIADRFLVSGFTGKALSGGGIFTRGAKGVGKGIITEVPTEVGQQVIERYQAGKSITSEEAINEYKEVAAAAGLIGGTVSSTGNIIGGDKSKKLTKEAEQDEDIRALDESAKVMNQNAQNFLNRGLPSPNVQGKVITEPSDPEAKFLTLSMLPDHIRQEVIDNRPDVYQPTLRDETLSEADLEVALNRAKDLDADINDADYNKVKDQVKLKGEFTQANARNALKTKKRKTIPQSVINRIRDKLIQNEVIKKQKGKLVPTTTTEQDIAIKAEQLKARAKEILNERNNLNKQRKEKLQNKQPVDDLDGQINDLVTNYDAVSKQAINLANESNKKLGTTALKASQIVPPIKAKVAFDNANVKTKEYKSKSAKVQDALRKSLSAIGLGDVKLDFQNILAKEGLTPQQQIATGTVNEGFYSNKTIGLAMEIYDPSLSEADLQQKLASVMNHEIIHALFNLGVLTNKEQKILVNAAQSTKYVVMIDGKPVKRQYSYSERAATMYPQLDSDGKIEEAIAEMYRDFADGKLVLPNKPKTIFQKIVNFIKAIFTAHQSQGFTEAGQIFENIGTTNEEKQIGRRDRNENIRSDKKFSTAGIVAGYIAPEKGNIERIKQSFKDVTQRLPKLEKAAQDLQDGKIDYAEYDKLVNEFKPIIPYITVPEPATTESMTEALAKDKVPFINKLQNVENGTTVRLRLDIPAYTQKGVWVPTIHDVNNRKISHESVAIVNGVSLEPTPGAQRIGLRIAAGAQKGPFATIEGKLEKTTPEAAFAEAQSAMLDPSFVQVGFDPERHSYFYDRTTTQPIIAADRAVQIGPLVMAKNPTFGRKQDYKYSSIGFAKPEPLNNRLLGIIKDNPDGFTVDPDSLDDMSSGIAVAPVKAAEIKVKPQDLNEETLYQFAENIYIMSQLSKTKIFAGGWTGPDGMFYLDATMLVDDYADALYIGEAAEQEGIFNLNNFEYTDTQDGIKGLQEANTYDGKRRAERQSNIRKLTEEFKKTRYQRETEQKSRISSPTRIEAGQERNIKEEVGYYPTVDNDGYVTLTHYSFEPNLAVISPDKQGTNFNIRGQETRRRRTFPSTYPSRNYYGLNVGEDGGYRKEVGVGDNAYEGKIEVNRLYPLDADPNGYRKQAAKEAAGDPDIGMLSATLMERKIKDAGFVGYWTGQQLGMVAAIFDDVAVLPEGTKKFSVKGLTTESINAINLLDDDKKFLQQAPIGSVKMTEAVRKFQDQRGNIVLDINNPEERELAKQALAQELEVFLDADQSAIGWYDEKIKVAKKLYAIDMPIIKEDKNADSAFDFLLAVTSNGESVKGQSTALKLHMDNWVETGKFNLSNQGMQSAGMIKALGSYNLLKEKGLSDLQIKEFLSKTASKKEIENDPVILGLETVTGKKAVISDENVDEVVPFSFIFGSKIGAFYQNIIGNYEYLTMDRWFMRTINRTLGTPFIKRTDKTLEKNRRESLDEVQRALTNGTADEKQRLKIVTDDLGIDIVNESNITEIATLAHNTFQKDYVSFRKKEGIEKARIFLNKYKTELFKKFERLAENSADTMQEQPKNPSHRKAIRDLYTKVVEQVNRNRVKKGINLPVTIADAQATHWYGEKRLFKSIGVRPGLGSDNDYVDSAIDFLRKRGIDEERIRETLPADYRERLDDIGNEGGESLSSTGEVAQNIGHEKREYTEAEIEDYDALSEVPQEDLAPLNETIEEQKFSLIGVPRVTGLYGTKGSQASRYAYGAINDGNRTRVILHVDGKHEEINRGKAFLYSGYGKKHINAIRPDKNKSHADELLEVFKYNSVEELLFDNLAKLHFQQTKGAQNGVEIVDTTATGLRLEFNKTPSRGPKRHKLIIPLKFIPAGQPLDSDGQTFKIGTYVIRTSYPEEKLYKYSAVGATPIMTQGETATSDATLRGVEEARQKIRYDNLSKILGKLGYALTLGRVEENKAREAAQNLLIQAQDRFLPVGVLIDRLRDAGVKITDALDVYMREELFHGIAGAKVDKVQKENFEPMVKTIDSLNVNDSMLDDLAIRSKFYRIAADGRYPSKKMALADAILYASHAKERNNYLKNDKASGMHTNEANRILAWVDALPDAEKTKINSIIKSAQDIVQITNQERKDGGLIPEVFVDKDGNEYTQIYDNYVPLRGDLGLEQEILEDNSNVERKENIVIRNLFGAIGRPDKKALGRIRTDEGGGSDYYAENIVASLFSQNNKSIADAERNKVGKSYLNLVRGIEDGSVEVNDNLKREMQDLSHVYFKKDEIPNDMRDKVLTVRENGKDVYVTFTDPRIARAMKGFMTPDSVGAFTRALGKLNRYLSNINTTYNPSFVIPNFARDLETAGVNIQQYDAKGITSEVLKGALPAVKGIAKNLRDGDVDNFWAKEYLKFVNAGGKNATNQMNDLQDQMNRINGILSDVADNSKKGKLGLVKKGFMGLGKFLDDYNTAVENGVRVATFSALKKRGFSDDRAAQAARNITVNFAKGGEQKQFLNSWYLFYNASLQGSMALINAAVKSPRVRKVWAGLIAYGVAQDAINAMLSGDEDEDGINDYDELPRYILEHNLVLPTFGLAEDKFITIPLAYGMNIAVNLGRSMSRAARGEYTAGQASRTIFGTAFESLSPFGGFDNFYNLAAPTVLDPFVSVAINEDYKGDPIFKESPQFASRPTPNSQAYWSSTSGIAKTIANSLNTITGGDEVESGFVDLSPDVMEFWFDYMTGGAGRFVQRSLESPFDIIDAVNGDFQGSVTRAIPFARKVIASPSDREDVSNYLENRKDAFTILARFDLARRSGDIDAINDILAANRKQLSIIPRLKAIDNARNRLLRQIREIERNPRLDEKMKKNIIRIRRERINDLMRRGLILMRSAGFKEAG